MLRDPFLNILRKGRNLNANKAPFSILDNLLDNNTFQRDAHIL